MTGPSSLAELRAQHAREVGEQLRAQYAAGLDLVVQQAPVPEWVPEERRVGPDDEGRPW